MKALKLIGIILIIMLFLFLYVMACYYIGIKGLNIFPHRNEKYRIMVYWILYWFISMSIALSIVSRYFLSVNNIVTVILTYIGMVYLALFFYLMILFPLADVMKFIFGKMSIKGGSITYLSKLYGNGILIFIIVFVIVSFGVWNAIHPVVTKYYIAINKKAGRINSLNIVMISDLHLGIAVRKSGIDNMVNSINDLKPDIVLFCGDMIDENTGSSLKKYFGESAKNIHSKYGIYGINGNHEYVDGNLQETIKYLKAGNINILNDNLVKIHDSFYLVGRDDPASAAITKKQVKPLKEALESIDKSIPVVVLNHQPTGLEEAKEEGVDLQLSGHTHRGQFFPNNFITNFVYEEDYGYLKKGDFNVIVSSGYGAWGPPIRIGTKSEIVNIKVKFDK